nr:NTE family protein rssA [Klebsiella pneumoniae]
MRKLKIGLALGAGAARGWSHIGVINALQRAGIEIDIVAGCSIGSLVGAAYACNRLPALESWVCSFSNWDVLKLMDLSGAGDCCGEKVFNHYRRIMPVTEIERCERRFAAVATNLSTGRELWFTEGDLHLAIRASCSMPGLMSPVRHNGYWLVDGAVVNPVPVSLTRAMGADIVIAVDLQHDAHLMQQDLFSLKRRGRKRKRRRAMAYSSARALDANEFPPYGRDADGDGDHDHLYPVLENRLKRNRMAGDPPDILLQPYCPQVSTLDFHRAGEAIAAGQLAVEKKMDELLPLVRTAV